MLLTERLVLHKYAKISWQYFKHVIEISMIINQSISLPTLFDFIIAYMRAQNQQGLNCKDVEYFKAFKTKSYGGHKKCPTSLSWNSSGSLLVTAQGLIKIWLLTEQGGLQKGFEIKGHDGNVDCAQWCGPNMLATLSRDSIKFWDVRETGKISQLRSQKRNKIDFVTLCWSNSGQPQSSRLATLNKQGIVNIHDLRNFNTPITTISPKPNSSSQVCAIAWDRSDSVLFLAGGESNYGNIAMYSAENYEQIGDPMITHCGRITDIVFTRNNERFATASEDSLLQVHTIPEIICERVFSHRSDSQFRRASFTPDGHYLAASCDSNFLQIYNAKQGGQSYRIKCSNSQELLSWHPKRNILAYIDEPDQRKSLDRGEEHYVHLFYQ